jgi:hypothetical protein
MGLDMYARKTKKKISKMVGFKDRQLESFYYWRKHPNLHGWMETLYFLKGGRSEFNLEPVQLTLTDLDHLERDLRAGRLVHTTGFLFGESDGTEVEGDLEFVALARAAIHDGYTVYYTSWW